MTLRDAIEAHNVVFVVGAGISVGASAGQPAASWIGLINDGIDRCEALIAMDGDRWAPTCRMMLEQGTNTADLSFMLAAASQVAAKLKSFGPQAYADWLADSVGQLIVHDHRVLDALRNSGFPILTTNYDTLLETDSQHAVAWTDTSEMQCVLAGESPQIGHLHGVWNKPDTVVLTDADYERHLQSPAIQQLQRAAGSIKTLVYVGCGDGLGDPNFETLLSWQRKTLGPSMHKHYRLCRDQDLQDLRRMHSSDNIEVESYGADFDDLPAYLDACLEAKQGALLTHAGKVRDPAAEARLEFQEQLHDHAVVLFPRGNTPDGEAPIIPPPMLRVPYGQYVKRKQDKVSDQLVADRISASDTAGAASITVVACEEGGGLTTTLRWLALKAADLSPGSTPVYLPFNQFSNRRTPLRSALIPYLRTRGLIESATDAFPPIILAVDDVHAYSRIAPTALGEMAKLGIPQIFVGCRVGDEDDILAILREAGSQPAVRYVGRFETREVTELLSVVAPEQMDSLMERVSDAFLRTNLPRTPMAVSSIIFILLYGDGIISSTASQSSILEQYVAILLGRGDIYEDAREGIEAGGREAVLASLAEYLVEQNTTALSESAVIAHFDRHFKRLGWTESATQVFNSLVRRGVLRRTRGGVEFHHNSFVYLFAAKRALSHPQFLDMLLQRPLYYSKVIQVFAGLARSNSTPIERILDTYEPTLKATGSDRGPAYSPIRQSAPPALPRELDDDPDSDEALSADTQEPEEREPSNELTPFDYPEQVLPLFSDDVDLTNFAKLVRVLDLLSSVIRDADQVEDLSLKRRALRTVLQGWGNLISAFHTAMSTSDLVETILQDFRDDSKNPVDEKDARRIAELLERILPVAAAMSGIMFTLKSRTLLVPVHEEMSGGEPFESEVTVAAALLLMSIREVGWTGRLRTLFDRDPNLTVWSDFFLPELEAMYESPHYAPEADRSEALEMILEIHARRYSFSSVADRTNYKERIRARLKKRHLEAVTRQRIKLES